MDRQFIQQYDGVGGPHGCRDAYILYGKGRIPITTAGAAALFLSPILMVGLSLLGCFVLMGIFPADAVFEHHSWLHIGVIAIPLYLPFFLFDAKIMFYRTDEKGIRILCHYSLLVLFVYLYQ